jgi:hypothetical protein
MKNLKWNLVKIKIRFERGYYWLKYIRDISLVIVAFDMLNIPKEYAIILVPLMYLIGYADERYGMWKMEYKYNLRILSKFKKKLFDM